MVERDNEIARYIVAVLDRLPPRERIEVWRELVSYRETLRRISQDLDGENVGRARDAIDELFVGTHAAVERYRQAFSSGRVHIEAVTDRLRREHECEWTQREEDEAHSRAELEKIRGEFAAAGEGAEPVMKELTDSTVEIVDSFLNMAPFFKLDFKESQLALIQSMKDIYLRIVDQAFVGRPIDTYRLYRRRVRASLLVSRVLCGMGIFTLAGLAHGIGDSWWLVGAVLVPVVVVSLEDLLLRPRIERLFTRRETESLHRELRRLTSARILIRLSSALAARTIQEYGHEGK